jgi:hypothetical protein
MIISGEVKFAYSEKHATKENDPTRKKRKQGKGEENGERETRWVEAEEFHKSAVSKQMRKCFEVLEKCNKDQPSEEATKGGTKRKQQATKKKEEDKSQTKLSNFFTKANKKEG